MTSAVRASYLDVLGATKNDCASMVFDVDGETIAVEFGNFRRGRALNLARVDVDDDLHSEAERLAAESQLKIVDVGDRYIEFGSRTDDLAVLEEQTEAILALVDGSFDDIVDVQHRNLEHRGPIGIVDRAIRGLNRVVSR